MFESTGQQVSSDYEGSVALKEKQDRSLKPPRGLRKCNSEHAMHNRRHSYPSHLISLLLPCPVCPTRCQ